MVKIINGEIVQDNDPRLKKATGSNANSVYNRKINSINSPVPQTPNNPSYPQQPSSQTNTQAGSNPLESVAKALGIDKQIITVPAIPPFGFTESKVGLIYFVVLGGLCLIFGLRSLIFGVAVYAMYKVSENNARERN